MKRGFYIFITLICLTIAACAENNAAATADEAVRGRTLTLRDFGSDDLGFLSLPDTAPTLGVLIIHDSWGLDSRIRRYCDAVAAAGNVSLAVDLYNGKVADSADLATQLQTGLIKDSAIKTIQAGILLFAESPKWKTERTVVIAFGRQADLALKITRNLRKEVVGMVWVEPEGEIDDNLFKKSNLPLKIISTGKAQDPNAFLTHLQSILSEEKRKLVFIEKYVAPKGFYLSTQKSEAQAKARNSVNEFWKACAKDEYQDRRNVFQKWIDKLQD